MTHKIKQLGFLGTAFFIVVIPILLFQFMAFKVNLTSSMPIGIYQKCHNAMIQRGDIVSFCLPRPIAIKGKLNGYIGSGLCPGISISLLKQVIAIPGDTVELSARGIRVNKEYYSAQQQAFNHQHRPIVHWVKNGTYKSIKTIWLYGSDDPLHSWDSRYFGGVPLNDITGIYSPIWVWSHAR